MCVLQQRICVITEAENTYFGLTYVFLYLCHRCDGFPNLTISLQFQFQSVH